MDSEQKNIEPRSLTRKKIWQLNSNLHCSVIGTCLQKKDLRQIAKKKVFGLEEESSDFSLHRMVSYMVGRRSEKSRALQKFLDQKYRMAIKRYSCLKEDGELLAQWREDLAAGASTAGAYWAVMTHPAVTAEAVDQIYGDCHMKSFETFSPVSQENRAAMDLQRNIAKLKAELSRSQGNGQSERKKREVEVAQHQKTREELAQLKELCQFLKEENTALHEQNQTIVRDSGHRNIGAEIDELRQQNLLLQKQLDTLNEEVDVYSEMLEQAEKSSAHYANSVSVLEQKNNEMKEELASLEAMYQVDTNGQEYDCETCEERLNGNCVKDDLSGKTILYVGGLHRMISRYREMVETRGGVFLHHDGGVENSKQILPRLLDGADVVLCPVDCVSHEACKCVKKICKQRCKPFVMMRSSGLSSLAKGLGTLVQ